MEELVRKIIHVDMDCFYAAIEARDFPELKGQPIAVGGQPHKRGVVATCSYEARAFGIHSAMPMGQAIKKCPQLIIQPVRMTVYQQESKGIKSIFKNYTRLIQPLSLDEAFLDVTGSDICHGSATLIAQQIRRDIWQQHQLTASAGIAPNKSKNYRSKKFTVSVRLRRKRCTTWVLTTVRIYNNSVKNSYSKGLGYLAAPCTTCVAV